MITLRLEDFKNCNGSKKQLPFSKEGCVMALGFFDGVHLAHRELLKTAAKAAKERGLPFAVYTFSSEGDGLKSGSPRLYSTEEKLSLLKECGVEYTVICDFDSVAEISAEDFISDILIGDFGVRIAVCGFNFRFGRGGIGTTELLKNMLKMAGAECIVLGEYLFEGETLSSSLIRELLAEGDFLTAARALGKPYFISGTVKHGLGKGRCYGIPTVNTELPEGRFPLKNGVYNTAVYIDGKRYLALTNVGSCPTFGERKSHAETFILDFSKDIYDSFIRIYFLGYLREERLFPSENELKMQINIDKCEALSRNTEIKWQDIGLN